MSQVLNQVRGFAAKIDEATNAIAAVLQPEVDRLTEMGKEPTT